MNDVMTKIVSLFMLTLILSMNVTYAAAIGSIYVSGQDGLNNIVRESDTVTINTQIAFTAAPDATNASTRAVIVVDEATQQYTPFSTCTHQLGQSFYNCTYTQSFDFAGYSLVPNQKIGFLSPSGDLDEVKVYSYHSDQAAPVINPGSFTAQQAGPNVSLSFSVTDSVSQTGGFAGICSGIKEVIVKLDNSPIGIKELNSSACSQNIVDLLVPTPAGTDGLHSIQIEVVDYVGLVSAQSGSIVTFDATPPTINNIRFTSGVIDPVTDISGFGDTVRVTFESTDVVSTRVFLNTSDFATPLALPVVCEASGTCQSDTFSLLPNRDYTIEVTAYDAVGNPNTRRVTRTIAIDDQSDTVLSVRSNITSGSINYLSQNSKITATIQANGAGYSKEQIALQVGSDVFAPNNCTLASGSSWNCVWDPVSVSHLGSDIEETVQVQIVGPGGLGLAKDDAGNDISFDSTNVVYIYDDLAPRDISHSSIIPYGAGFEYDFAVSYSDLGFNVSYAEISPVTISVNASELGKSELIVIACTAGECAIRTGAIGPGPYNNRMEIEIRDVVGNTARLNSELVEVLMSNYSENTSAFDHDLALSPSALERSSSEYFGQKSFADVLIRAENGNVLDARLVGCRNVDEDDLAPASTGDADNFIESLLNNQNSRGDLAYVGGFNMIDTLYNDDGSASILFTVDFLKKEIQQDSVSFYCDIDVAGTWGNQFVPRETESILLQFGTYDFSLGTLPDNYEADLEEAKAVAEDHISSKLGFLRSLLEIATLICNLITIYTALAFSLGVSGDGVKAVGEPLIPHPFTTEIGWATKKVGDTLGCGSNAATAAASEIPMSALEAACQFVTCERSLMGGILDMAGGSSFTDSGVGLVENRVLSNTLGGATTTNEEGETSFNPLQSTYAGNSQNLVSSVVNLCIPGILYNLEKDRQIECKYALCLQDDVPQGLPKEACEAQRAYAKCAYITGGISEWLLNTLPISSLIQQFRQALSDPLGAVGLAFSLLCQAAQCRGWSWTSQACFIPNMAKQIQEVMRIINAITSVLSYFDDEAQLDYCSELGLDTDEGFF